MQTEIEAPTAARSSRGRRDCPHRSACTPSDNVAIVVNAFGLPAGTVFPDGLNLVEFVPQGHKVALADIPEGGEVRRYGEVVGIAMQAIPRGLGRGIPRRARRRAGAGRPADRDRACRHRCRRSRATPSRASATRTARWAPRTSWAISTSVQASPARSTTRSGGSSDELLPRFPNVDDVVGLPTPMAAASPSTRPAR